VLVECWKRLIIVFVAENDLRFIDVEVDENGNLVCVRNLTRTA